MAATISMSVTATRASAAPRFQQQKQQQALRMTKAMPQGMAARLGASKASPSLRAERASTVTRALKDYSAEFIVPSETEEQRWGYVIANAKFLLNDEEHMAEILRERRRMFTEKDRPMDFFIVTEPKWIEALPKDVQSRLGRPAAAIVSTDLTWITFMKLRLDKVHKGEFDAMKSDATASNGTVPDFEAPPHGNKGDNFRAPYKQYSAGWWKIFVAENN